MNLHVTNPLSDGRWDELVSFHPRASAFHRRGWLEALVRTYGYEPFALTSAPPGQPMRDGVLLCRVSSWITGSRLVSLPFADHCEPLLKNAGEFQPFAEWLCAERDTQRLKYVEMRPLLDIQDSGHGLRPAHSYFFHELDLTPSLDQIFRGLHKDSIQRKIRRAEREQLSYESGCSEQFVDDFYRLLLITRKRHQLPPQPRIWFSNLTECMGEAIQIWVARKNDAPVAALLTLRHRSSVIYKYGCSDEKFHSLGGMPYLFWRLIEESKESGAETLDFGRSDIDNAGLVTFKGKFGTKKKLLTYYRYPGMEKGDTKNRWGLKAVQQAFSILPDSVMPTVGRILYRHMG